mgnify:CR=1 FL=1
MQTLSIDIETYSNVNLSKCGVYKYTESPDFEILLFGYSADGSDVTVIDLAQGERLPQEITEALTPMILSSNGLSMQILKGCAYPGISVIW